MTDDRTKRLENQMDRIDANMDKVADNVHAINLTLAKQNVTLEEHVRRTNLLESKLAPIERHVAMVNGGVKFLVLLSVIAGIIKAFI